jgi:phage tail P2-like protein
MNDLLPPNATAQERAISLALDRAVPVPVRQLWNPATCPEGILPWLAWSLSVDEWDAAWPVDQKRSAIAASIETHRRKGTIGSLRRALQALGYDVEIDEKTGEAYTFRLLFKVGERSAGGALIDAAVTNATAIALRQKNARSALAGSQYLGTNGATGGPIIAAAQLSGSETDVAEFSGPTGPPMIEISGTTFPANLNKILIQAPDLNGRQSWTTNGSNTPPLTGRWVYLQWSGTVWGFGGVTNGSYDDDSWSSADDVLDPLDIETWIPGGSPVGEPVLTAL